MTLTKECLGLSDPIELANCGLVYVYPSADTWIIVRISDNCFLEPYKTVEDNKGIA